MGSDDQGWQGFHPTVPPVTCLHFSFQIRYQLACAQSGEHMAAFRSGNSHSFSVRVSLHHRGGSKGFPDRLSLPTLVDIAHDFKVLGYYEVVESLIYLCKSESQKVFARFTDGGPGEPLIFSLRLQLLRNYYPSAIKAKSTSVFPTILRQCAHLVKTCGRLACQRALMCLSAVIYARGQSYDETEKRADQGAPFVY
jgi:hypothetical protein